MSDGIQIEQPSGETAPNGLAERLFTHPRAILWAGVALLVLCGWVYIGLMVVDMVSRTDMAEAGPGMSVFNYFSDWAELGDLGRELIRSICGPIQSLAAGQGWSFTDAALVFAMWTAMTIAMMVPTAAPMITAYAEIGQTARRKGITIVPTAVLVAGYLSVWLVFCVAATLAQWALSRASLMTPGLVLGSTILAGGLLISAGLYQFSSLKVMCLTKCDAVAVFHGQLERPLHRRVQDGRLSGRRLRHVLLGADAGDVCRRAHERDLDGRPGGDHGDGEDPAQSEALVRGTGAALILAGTALLVTQ